MKFNKNLLYFFSSPPKLYLLWFILIVIFCLAIPILSIGAPGGEQKPLTLLSYATNYFFYGYFVLGVLTSIFYRQWFKKYWYVNLVIVLLTGGLIGYVYFMNKVN